MRDSTKKTTPQVDADFEVWWLVWPNKQAKKDALKAWAQTSDERPALEVLIEHAKVYARTRKVENGFLLLPATYLRQARWTDVYRPEEMAGYRAAPAVREVAWWVSEAAITQKANECGVALRPGETWAQLKGRVANALASQRGMH
jgi:hypothetical protein